MTSFGELRSDGVESERWNTLHPTAKQRTPYVTECLSDGGGPVVAATDYIRGYADLIRAWVPGTYRVLGTDGFGRSENRASLRDFFEVDAKHIVLATLTALARDKQKTQGSLQQAIKDLGINPEKPNPAIS